MNEIKKFNGLNVSSKFAICGLPIRIDSYKTCSFGCKYCFAENRKIMQHGKEIQIANVTQVKNKLKKIFDKRFYRKSSPFSPMFQFDEDGLHSKETVINKNVFIYNNKKYEQETLF